jgi:hypothetical protein
MGAINLKSGRILSSHQPGVKRFILFVFFDSLAEQCKQVHFFAVEEDGGTFHFEVRDQNGRKDSLIQRDETAGSVCDHDGKVEPASDFKFSLELIDVGCEAGGQY